MSGAVGDRPFVAVHDAGTGRPRGCFPSWRQGAGADRVVVDHGADTGRVVEFWTFSAGPTG